ncbi:MAG: biotin synthase BioB [Candidatus Cloacimonadota bacterium]|nr:MAG: biotin synthase BioB [Candidatus Cloacimonadota bacterium]
MKFNIPYAEEDDLIENGNISEETAIKIAEDDKITWADLAPATNFLREKFHSDKIFTCSILNAKSGHCPENCAFCAQSVHHETGVKIYPLVSYDKLVESGLRNAEQNATQYSFVTAGHSVTEKELEIICKAARALKEKTDLALCGSLGMLTEEKAKMLVEAGVERFHHNLETAPSYFSEICSTHTLEEDYKTIEIASAAGMKICCGGIIGLGESWKQRTELAFTLKKMKVDSIPLNFLNPIKGTRLENQKLLSAEEALKTIALFRLINPQTPIGIAGGRELILGEKQEELFRAGANGIMIGNYLTTSGRAISNDNKMIKKLELNYEKI